MEALDAVHGSFVVLAIVVGIKFKGQVFSIYSKSNDTFGGSLNFKAY